ncbi:MAG TPA: F0F1 ATP synthase subunit epsilon [Chloroflexia bacterium]|nr:F0F1 ATP synthase subunit epsilon [Chloroflexia bacterium]
MPLTLEIVTAERLVYSDDNVDMVVAPSVDGEVGILPHHAPLLTLLQIGELRVTKGSDEQSIVIAGGFLEVLNNKVTVLADVAERAEEIDAAAAEDARRRAQDALANRGATADLASAEAAMRLASLRLRVGQRRRRLRQEEG